MVSISLFIAKRCILSYFTLCDITVTNYLLLYVQNNKRLLLIIAFTHKGDVIMSKTSLIIAGLICTVVIAFIIPGFKSNAASNEPKQSPSLGGWSLVEENNTAMLEEDDANRIQKVLKESGSDLEVLDLIATQVVAGVNYMYLTYGTPAGSTVPGYYFVTIYEDLKGNDTIIGTTPIDVTAVQTMIPLGKGATGAWAVSESGKACMFADQNAQASFDAINNGKVMYNPVALLATQLVSGTNYKALCKGNDMNLYVVTWYRNLQGNASLTSAECVNLGAYSGR